MKSTDELKEKIAAFSILDFGVITPMPSGLYPPPPINPRVGQHPRLNLNADMLPGIGEVLKDRETSALAKNFWELADEDFDGAVPEPLLGKSNYNGRHHAIIEAKALAYLLTKDERYAYEAILAAKNYMLTVVIRHDLASDIFRGWGRIMTVVGEVYDWCYDLMTQSDREQFMAGVEWKLCRDCTCGKGDKMTIGFPPVGQNAVQGHGTNVALQRDYLGYAIAVYDEYPDWWELIGGRFYAEYVPANNVFYKAGMNPQGTNNYVWGKFYAQLHSAWLIKAMSGEHPYERGIEDVVYGLMGMKMPNGKYFLSGDGPIHAAGAAGRTTHLAVAAALFPSAVLKYHARVFTNDYTYYDWNIGGSMMTPSLYAIFLANGYKGEEARSATDGLKTVYYYGSPMGQMTVRNDWSENAAAALMRVSELSGGNHDHDDAGTFQIYYKGCYTAESGHYGAGAGYGTSHHKYWHQATISHNAILVYNPALAETCGGWYSGGQEHHGGVSTVDEWLRTDKQKTGKITAHEYALDEKGSPEYAYLAGDITPAYNPATVTAHERRMLAVSTGDETMPMIFTVYDRVGSTDASFKKSFLMHTVTEPAIDGNTATYVMGGGKMLLTTLTDGARMTKHGGAGNTFFINEEKGSLNVAEDGRGTAARKGDSDVIADGEMWGRVQIDSEGRSLDHMLNVITVMDADRESPHAPTKFENDAVIGMQTSGIIAAFCKSAERTADGLLLSSSGEGKYKYFISGLSAGEWTVSINGETIACMKVPEDSGLLCFEAFAGDVVISPVNK